MKNHSAIESPQEGKFYDYPCCRYKTLSARGDDEICPVCFWQDDGQDDRDAEVVRGGPNYSLSLAQARINFQNFGACEKRLVGKVRKPLPEEISAL